MGIESKLVDFRMPSGVSIPVAEVIDLVKALVENGVDRAQIPGQVAAIFDSAFNFTELVPGPVGVVLESVDGRVIKAVAKLVLAAVPDPEVVN